VSTNLETISHYKVLEKLGSGGMGEVYLVSDTKLNRKAALKILPTRFAVDRKHLNRFWQEARLAATLNHPNICTVYEIDDRSETPFIALEYVEGETLAEKIDGKSFDLSEVLEIAVQIADALDEAHRHGIIHRDIKAANVIINKRGRVKVLDFGLAKTFERESSEQEVTRAKTESGMLVGTVQYMSPEQALGKELDGRTDLWSFGVVLYEMTTGRLPFKGATVAAAFDAILHEEPIAPGELNQNLPAEFENIILKLLEKDRDFRYQTASDLRADLKRLQRASFSELNVSDNFSANLKSRTSNRTLGQRTNNSRQTTAPEISRSISKLPRFAIPAVGAILLIVLAAAFYGFYFNSAAPQADSGFKVGEVERLTSLGKVNDAVVSPDGKYIAYVSNEGGSESLWLKQIQTGSNIQVIAPQNVSYQGIAISPDGSWIYYNVWDRKGVGQIFRIPVLGGMPQKVIHDCMPGITLSPDGKRLAFIRSSAEDRTTRLINAGSDGGDERDVVVNNANDNSGIFTPAWSPDGKTIAFAGAKLVSPGKALAQIWEVPADGGERKVIWTSSNFGSFFGNNLTWLPDKSGMLITSGSRQQFYLQIWKISYPDGKEEQLTRDFNSYRNLSISSDGKLLVSTQEDISVGVWTVPIDNPSQAKKITSGKLEGMGVAWTPDNRVVYSSAVSGNPNIWIADADGSNKKQLTSNNLNLEPCVAANGKYIVFTSSHGGTPGIWSIDLDGNNLRKVTENYSWSVGCAPLSNRLFVSDSAGLGMITTEGGEVTHLADNVERRPAVSPDGKRIAYIFWNEKEKRLDQEILNIETGERRRFEMPPDAIRSINQPPVTLRWTPDGKALAYVRDAQEVSNIWTLPLEGGKPRQITGFNENYIAYFDWSPDGKQLVVSRGSISSDAVLIRNGK
jgi:serine/threonine protein kinase